MLHRVCSLARSQALHEFVIHFWVEHQLSNHRTNFALKKVPVEDHLGVYLTCVSHLLGCVLLNSIMFDLLVLLAHNMLQVCFHLCQLWLSVMPLASTWYRFHGFHSHSQCYPVLSIGYLSMVLASLER